MSTEQDQLFNFLKEVSALSQEAEQFWKLVTINHNY